MQFGTILSVYDIYLFIFLLIYYLGCWYMHVTKKHVSGFVIGMIENLSLLRHLWPSFLQAFHMLQTTYCLQTFKHPYGLVCYARTHCKLPSENYQWHHLHGHIFTVYIRGTFFC